MKIPSEEEQDSVVAAWRGAERELGETDNLCGDLNLTH